jgi:hypothetical protein
MPHKSPFGIPRFALTLSTGDRRKGRVNEDGVTKCLVLFNVGGSLPSVVIYLTQRLATGQTDSFRLRPL